MRQDKQVHDLIREKRAVERNSACCVRNDRSGCVQTSEEQCSVCKQSQFLLALLDLCALEPQMEAADHYNPFLFAEYFSCVG